jgi:hypothetical protein
MMLRSWRWIAGKLAGRSQRSRFTLDPDRHITNLSCDDCGGTRDVITGFVYQGEQPHAVYYAACYPQHGEVYLDVILGTWTDEVEDDNDHVTFGCRYGKVEDRAEPACTLVSAAAMAPQPVSPLFGKRLDREQALKHPWLGDFWAVVDFLVYADPTVHTYMHPGAAS